MENGNCYVAYSLILNMKEEFTIVNHTAVAMEAYSKVIIRALQGDDVELDINPGDNPKLYYHNSGNHEQVIFTTDSKQQYGGTLSGSVFDELRNTDEIVSPPGKPVEYKQKKVRVVQLKSKFWEMQHRAGPEYFKYDCIVKDI